MLAGFGGSGRAVAVGCGAVICAAGRAVVAAGGASGLADGALEGEEDELSHAAKRTRRGVKRRALARIREVMAPRIFDPMPRQFTR